MSTTTSVYVGYYLKAKLQTIEVLEHVKKCSSNSSHLVIDVNDAHHCSICGAELTLQTDTVNNKLSIENISYTTDISEEDTEWLEDTFSFVQAESIGEEEYDYLLYDDGYAYFEADWGGWSDISNEFKLPYDVDLDRLKKLLKYQSVELKFGALVSVA